MSFPLRCLATVLLLFPVIAINVSAAGDDAEKSAVEKELDEHGKRWQKAVEERDEETLRELLAEDFMAIETDGSTKTREQYIENVTQTNLTYREGELKNLKVRIYGNTAVVTARAILDVTKDGRDLDVPVRVTSVLVKRNGRWEGQVLHGTLIR
ncbi:SnoaL-like domain protein [Maioricimonas rarisocia]|uniref:SnoaL-like domain protein n=1 Tax=Maioricimonas rarisocia TaxID=2528026 RepID=A0A517Z253_9PLAN|nr:nuclear transport factor 2 family protein [Maioricimonas rarisocia]QDU36519.1 SnoaL-like domain protein [Maioricimonas rarisocia]